MSSAHFNTSFNSQFTYIINWDHLCGAFIHCTKKAVLIVLWGIVVHYLEVVPEAHEDTLNIIAVKTISPFLLLECKFLSSLCLKAHKKQSLFLLTHPRISLIMSRSLTWNNRTMCLFLTLPTLNVCCVGRGPRDGVEWTEIPWWRYFIWSLLDVIG